MHLLALTLLTMASTWNPSIPFTYVDNRMMIECRIDGKGPFHMVVDTGSPTVLVTPQVAGRLGLSVHNAGTVTGAGNNSVQNGSATLRSLLIGSLEFRGLNADVISLDEIRTKLHFPHLDGIVGYPIFDHFEMLVNVDKQVLSLTKSLPPLPAGASTTAFEGVLPIVQARIDGIKTRVLVDTGDRSSLTLFGPFAKHYGFYGRFPGKRNIVTGYGLGGPVYGDVFTLPSLDVLGVHISNVVTRASRQTVGVFASTDEGGSIGTGVLRRFNIVYDYPHKKIFAWPSKYFTTRDAFHPPS